MDYLTHIVAIGILFVGISESGSKYESPEKDFQDIIREISEAMHKNEKTEKHEVFNSFDDIFAPNPFNCTVMSRTNPTSVNRLTPADIDIVAALGDSITAGSGMKAGNIIAVSSQYREDSWSIGGNEVGLDGASLTLPNILRKYNPNLKGYSNDSGEWDSPGSGLNFAIPGSVSTDIPDQAERLIAELRNNPMYDMDNEWKLLTILIGGNDMCAACEDSLAFNPFSYRLNLEVALANLYNNVPRMLVQFVPMFDISPIKNISTGQPCDFLHKLACPCAVYQEFRNPLKDFQLGYYDVLKDIVDSRRYDKEDFTVVLQPYLMEMTPLKLNNTIDYGFFAVDCFHPSLRGHRVLAFELWETMFSRVGRKKRTIEVIDGNFYKQDHNYHCPAANEYIYTLNNSEIISPYVETTPLEEEVSVDLNVRRSKTSVMSIGDAIEVLKQLIEEEEPAPEPSPAAENNYDELFHPENFTCKTYRKDLKRNLTVHSLTAADIDIVAAAGDSITAGSGLGAESILGIAQEQRGRVWSMGGDGNGSLDTGYLSLPNILRQYNPNLKGASIKFGEWGTEEAGLNFAVPGAVAPLMPEQARRLIDALKTDPQYDFEEDWKLFTLLIGGNDLCATCIDETVYNPRSYVSSIRAALDILQAEVPKMLVQVVPMFDVSDARKITTNMFCDFIQMLACPCARFEEFRQPHLRNIQLEYYDELTDLIDTGRYDTRDDFTVVIQPFLVEMKPLLQPGSEAIDKGFFAVDCFHPSWRGHRVMAHQLWENMFVPVGEKNMSIPEDFYDRTPHQYYCPSNETYIQTNENNGLISNWLKTKTSSKQTRKLKKRDTNAHVYNVPNLQHITSMYTGDAVSAIKDLAKMDLDEETESTFQDYDDLFRPREFDCEIIQKTGGSGPATVHELRPGDIGIIAALGDSITTGQGIGATNVITGSVQQRGRAWSIGGQSTLENGYLTLPNILEKYNPDLKGFSTAAGEWDVQRTSKLNLALRNSASVLLPLQMQRLIDRMKEMYPDEYETEWKLLTIMIGRNDLCNQCEDSNYYTIDNFVKYVTAALDLASKEIPKMLIQIVPQYDISPLRNMAKTMTCDFIQKLVCPCALYEDFREPLRNMQVQFYERINEIIKTRRYDQRDDFTIVMQPFMVYDDPFTLPGTDNVDKDFFGSDCLHPSWRAHRIFAFNAWESMFTPVEKKKTKTPSNFYEYEHFFHCPTARDPYIKTYNNSDTVLPTTTSLPTTTTPGDMGTTIAAGVEVTPAGHATFLLLLVTLVMVWRS